MEGKYLNDKVVVVGAGHCAGQLAARLRQEGMEGEITVIGDEPHPPYQRPPLSKGYFAGEEGRDRVLLRPAEFYGEKGIDLRLSTVVEVIDREAAEVGVSGR